MAILRLSVFNIYDYRNITVCKHPFIASHFQPCNTGEAMVWLTQLLFSQWLERSIELRLMHKCLPE